MILYIYLVYRYEKLCLGKVVNVNFFVITWMLIVWYGSFRNKKNEIECLKEWVFACCDVSVGKV
jgi:hypothetical protein